MCTVPEPNHRSPLQLHNPYIATPLSIDQFKMAISPSDKDNVRVVDWLDRLQSSGQQPPQASAARMEIIREMRRSSEDPTSAPGAGAGAGVPVSSSVIHTTGDSDEVVEDDDEDATEEEDAEKARSALPDVTVPIGLLANLSLDKDNEKEKGRGKGKARPGTGVSLSGAVGKPEEDDGNVVRIDRFFDLFRVSFMGTLKGVANREYFRPGMSSVAAMVELLY